MTTCRATTAALSVPVFDAGNISPHLAPLFPARWPRSARQSAPSTLETVRQRLRDAVTRRGGLRDEALVECCERARSTPA